MSARQFLGKAIRGAIPAPIARIIARAAQAIDPHSIRTYSQEGEDLILRRLFHSRANGFYVDVGAHHPRRFSNTFYFYEHGWSGINIDPNVAAMELFAVARPRDVNIAMGVSDARGKLQYFVFDEPALNTLDVELAEKRQRTTDYRLVRTIEVPVDRLDAILEQHVPRGRAVDFMSVDTEGHDFNVVKSNDWARYRPRYLLVECLDSSLASMVTSPLDRFMLEHGYELFAKTLNTVFYHDTRQTE
jgi:FkbM family methyltransferase